MSPQEGSGTPVPEEEATRRDRAMKDVWQRTLSQIPTTFGKVAHLASLRNENSGQYEHFGLAQLYSDEEADRVLGLSHHQVFREWLNFPLESNGRIWRTIWSRSATTPLVNLDKRSGTQHRIHQIVIGADQPVAVIVDVEIAQQTQRHPAPLLDGAAQIRCLAKVGARVQLQGQRHGAARTVREVHEVRLRGRYGLEVLPNLVPADAVPFEHFSQIKPVDGAKAVESMETGNDTLVFDVGEAAEADYVVRVAVFLCDQVAGVLHLAVS